MTPTTAILGGHELHVPAYWEDLSQWERDTYANGCGRASWPDALCALLDSYSGFHECGNIHDVEWELAGQECVLDSRHSVTRYAALLDASNERFYANCRTVVKDHCRPLWRHPICRIRGELRARAFWRAVQIGAATNVLRMRRTFA